MRQARGGEPKDFDMRILIDMDDVLEHLVDAMVEWINEKYGTSAKVEDVREWDMTKAFPTLEREQVYSCEFDDEFWKTVKPMEGADEALRTLIAEGHEIYIVTASFYQTMKSKMENVLFRYYPYLDWNQVIITRHKQMLSADVLIDDGPHNLEGGNYRKILFEANHNRDFDEKSIGAVRVRNWSEALAEINRSQEPGVRSQGRIEKQSFSLI